MLRVSKLTDYGSVILTHMACHPEQKMSAASLARSVLLPPATVRKLLKMLVASGLLYSRLGKHGGYQLARAAQDISLAEIINVFEGGIALTECSLNKGTCRIKNGCTIRHHWQGINQIVYQSLVQVSLQEMLPLKERAELISLSG